MLGWMLALLCVVLGDFEPTGMHWYLGSINVLWNCLLWWEFVFVSVTVWIGIYCRIFCVFLCCSRPLESLGMNE